MASTNIRIDLLNGGSRFKAKTLSVGTTVGDLKSQLDISSGAAVNVGMQPADDSVELQDGDSVVIVTANKTGG